MPETVTKVITLLAVICCLFLIGKLLFRFFRDRYGKVRSVKAQVADKFQSDRFSKLYGSAARAPQYYIVFSIGEKKKSFQVSEFSYNGYRKGERGTLRYRGSRLIGFE